MIMPILESFTEFIQVILEGWKIKIAVKVAEGNKKIKELTKNDAQEEGESTAIGFVWTPNEEEQEEYDDDV